MRIRVGQLSLFALPLGVFFFFRFSFGCRPSFAVLRPSELQQDAIDFFLTSLRREAHTGFCPSYTINNNVSRQFLEGASLPFLRWDNHIPIVSLSLNNRQVDVRLDARRGSALRVFAAVAVRRNWATVVLITDKGADDIDEMNLLALDESLSVGLIVSAETVNATDSRRLERLADVIVKNHDAAVVSCSTTNCYNTFLSIVRHSPNAENFVFMTNEATTQKLSLDTARGVADASHVVVVGIRKAYVDYELFERVETKVASMHDCSSLFDVGCPLARERELENVINLFEAVELAVSYHEHRKTWASGKEKEIHLFSRAAVVTFDNIPKKLHTTYDVLEHRPTNRPLLKKIGFFHDGQLALSSPDDQLPLDRKRRHSASRRPPNWPDFCPPATVNEKTGKYHFNITTIEERPFLIKSNETGQIHLTGFLVDFVKEMASQMNFDYTMTLVPDDKYGNVKEENGTLQAVGMIEQILECKTHLAVSAMAITASRAAYVSFTKPWMDYGLSLYRRKPTPEKPRLFAFLDPFDSTLWYTIIGMLFGIAILMVIVHHISPFSRLNAMKTAPATHHHSPRQPHHNHSQNVFTSAWLLYVTAMQQEPDYIGFLSGKLLLGGWFLFCLIAISTYTANLAAFLTFQRIPDGISSVDDLATQTKTAYGTVRDTAVEEFFKTSQIDTYKRMGQYMTDQPDEAMTDSADEAVKRVHEKDYIFIWDSPILEYFATQAPCETEVIGRTFNQKGYGIAMPFGMPYLENFTLTVLKMRDQGKIDTIAREWLNHGDCVSESAVLDAASDAGRVGIEHMKGVLLLLGVTSGIALIVASLERLVWWLTSGRKVGARNLSEPSAAQRAAGAEREAYMLNGGSSTFVNNGHARVRDLEAVSQI
ncbi:glutamate receptor ionotropic, kainate 3-like isoform X2 [Oscarella lobularis]